MDDRDDHRQHVDLLTDLTLDPGQHLGRQRLQGRRRGVAVLVDRQRVVVLELGVERGVEVTGHERVPHVGEVAVVAEQAVSRRLLDPPPDGGVHAGRGLVGDPDGDARVALVRARVVVRLDGGIHLGHPVPRRHHVEAVGQTADRPAERGLDADVLGRDDRRRSEERQYQRDGTQPEAGETHRT